MAVASGADADADAVAEPVLTVGYVATVKFHRCRRYPKQAAPKRGTGSECCLRYEARGSESCQGRAG